MQRTRALGFLVPVLLAAAQAGADPAPLTPAQIAQRASPSVVLLRLPDGLGSGFVVGRDGRIATNYHVIVGGQVVVVLPDGREFKDPEVLATDEARDLAVLRIPARDLKPLVLAATAGVHAGDRVVAIGHPLGLDHTVSDGLVSAVRQLSPELSILQISAPISPGSSGGPLFNDRGEVVGVSTLIVTQGQNLNFAMPSDALRPLLVADRGTPIAVWRAKAGGGGGGAPHRNVPHHELSVLAGCSADQLSEVAHSIDRAIGLGAPLYNQGNHEACFRIYESTALEVDRKIEGCPGPRRALLDGVKRAQGLPDYTSKAWAMRDAFDGVLDVIARVAASAESGGERALPRPPVRHVPHHPAKLLEGCSRPDSAKVAASIADAIEVGAPLYNAGNFEACFRVYQGASLDVSRKVPGCAGPKRALSDGMQEAERRASWADKAWAMRDAFDGLLELFQRAGGEP